MAQKTYIIEGRQFRTEADYNRASHDKEIIDKLRLEIKGADKAKIEQLRKDILDGKYRFLTILGQDFADELSDMIKRAPQTTGKATQAASRHKRIGKNGKQALQDNPEFDAIVQEELKKREKRRRLLILACSLLTVGCLGYFGWYSYEDYRVGAQNDKLSELKDIPLLSLVDKEPVINYVMEGGTEPPEVLDEYKNLLIANKKLIGWVKIDDTNIDYPVMQTSDNEFYQDHNVNREPDKNGAIFMDKDCDVLKPSTNYILYGHHMRSGQMFGKLDLYEDEEYYKDHPYIQFDTIYEKGTYQVMYVFRSRVYKEEDIVFKYYQFIDAASEQEFYSNMEEMAKMSLYDTGVTAQYGDRLLTLSTCDYQEKDGRFVVVAKKVATKE